MYNAIKRIYPDIKDSEFSLQDNATGDGVYIARWDYKNPQPTELQIASVDMHPLSEFKPELIQKIDDDVDDIYAKVVGNRFAEYQDTAAEAKAFKDASYIGTAGSSIVTWATVKGMTTTWATDDILETAAAWKAVQAQLRRMRLTHKEQARVAASYTQLQAIHASWISTLTYIKTSLGIS